MRRNAQPGVNPEKKKILTPHTLSQPTHVCVQGLLQIFDFYQHLPSDYVRRRAIVVSAAPFTRLNQVGVGEAVPLSLIRRCLFWNKATGGWATCW